MKRIMTLVMVSAWCLVTGCNREQTKNEAKPEKTAKPALTISGTQTNSLGMIFVPVKGTDVLFSIWETRVQDYQAFVTATGRDWKMPWFDQGPTHPAVNVSREDAKEFCAWVTQKERATGKIGANQEYRLPTDAEWSMAVGLGAERGNTPADKDGKIKEVYPWGNKWPPPQGAGNYDGYLKLDNFAFTSPVGSFAPNQFGLFDMGGNVWEWCEDLYEPGEYWRVLRGASWGFSSPDLLLSSFRLGNVVPGARYEVNGFRCVLMVGGTASSLRKHRPGSSQHQTNRVPGG